MLIAIITARGGSKGLPGKNIITFNKLPLIVHSIKAAQESGIFDKILVSTDCCDIAKVAQEFGSIVLMRPSVLAEDTTSSYDVVEHVIKTETDLGNKYTSFVLLQPTSPLRKAEHIKEAYHLYLKSSASSVLSIVETETTPFKYLVKDSANCFIEPLFNWEDLSKPRQVFPKTYEVNGAIYICNINDFILNKSFFSYPIEYYLMDRASSIDIDTLDDLYIAEYYVSKR